MMSTLWPADDKEEGRVVATLVEVLRKLFPQAPNHDAQQLQNLADYDAIK